MQRTRLIALIREHHGPVAVRAGRASGKSILARQLAAATDRPIHDDVDPGELVGMAPNAVVLSRLPLQLDDRPGHWLRLDEADLWFDADDVEVALITAFGAHPAHPAMAAAIQAGTAGWPGAVGAIVRLIAHRPRVRCEIDRVAIMGPHLDVLIDEVLGRLTDGVRADLAQLASFPVLLPAFFDGLDECPRWPDARRLALPLRTEPDGSITMPPPLRSRLAGGTRLTHAHAVAWGHEMARGFGIAEALHTLSEIGAWEAAQTVLVALPEQARYASDHLPTLRELRHLLGHVDVVEPETLLTVAGLALRLARFDELDAAVERLEQLATERDLPNLVLRSRLMCLLGQARRHAIEIPQRELDELDELQRVHGDERSELELGKLTTLVLAGRSDVASLDAAIRLGEETAHLYAARGDWAAGAELLRQLAVGPLLDLGRYREMETLDRQAMKMARETMPSQRTLVFRAVTAVLIGDLSGHQRAVDELDAIYGQPTEGWLGAYVWGARMIAASLLGSPAGVAHSYARYRQLIGELADAPSGALWEAFAAQAFAITGVADEAERVLVALRERPDGNGFNRTMAELVVAARVGDPRAAFGTAAAFGDGELGLEQRWRVDLELAIAASRLGDPPPVPLHTILDTADQVGMRGLAEALALRLRNEPADTDDVVEISIFGAFSVRIGARSQEMGGGHPADLLKVLTLRGGTAHIETIVDCLWPEDDPMVGRRRLRNVLNRARQIVGESSLVRTGEILSFGSTVTTDLAAFDRVRAAAATSPKCSDEFLRASRTALEIAREGLLPSDRYAPWADGERWRVDAAIGSLLHDLFNTPDVCGRAAWLGDLIAELVVAYPDLVADFRVPR